MKAKPFLVALGALSLALVACSNSGGPGDGGDGDGDGMTPGTAGGSTTPGAGSGTGGSTSMPPGSGGTTSPGGGVGNGATAGAPPDPQTCIPGIPATTQIPRLLNRQYDAVVRDLLGVTTVGTTAEKPSQRLIGDFTGPMTADAWRVYVQVAGEIARDVMAGANKSKFISCDPAAAQCMDQTIRNFGRKAFRRKMTDDEVARFKKLGEAPPQGTTPAEIAEATLQAFLVSPSFLLIPEVQNTPDVSGMGTQLSPHEVAARLSFLLWGSVPDEMLNAAADANQLQTKDQIRAQAERMVAVREKTGPFVASFHRNWLQMNNSGSKWWKLDHDTKIYPLYNAAAKPTLAAELDAFFEEVVFSKGSFKDLLLSNVGFVNKDTAAIYGLEPAMYGTELVKVELTNRPGFLTRAGFLSSYANYDATSPILRGAFILSQLLGANPGPPDENAIKATAQGQFSTQRAYVEALTMVDSACKGCHSVINPPGFILENYDAIGKWQDVDPRGGKIDASVTTATLAFGAAKEVSTPAQLMQEIAQSPKSRELYAKAWVSFAYGRPSNANDKCVVDQLNANLSQDGYGILDVLADLTQADTFRVRVRETP